MVGFEQRIKAARQRAGLTQAQLAELSGVQQGNISHYERGDRVPTAATFVLLSAALRVSVGYLITGEQPRRTITIDAEDVETLRELLREERGDTSPNPARRPGKNSDAT